MNKKQIKLILSLASIILILGLSIYPTRISKPVFAENNQSSEVKDKIDSVNIETPEPKGTPEPTETPEQEVENEKEVEQTHQEIKNEIETGNIKNVEIQSSLENPGKGSITLERTNGSTTEKTVSSSQNASIVDVETQSGKVSIHVEKDGTVTLINNGINIQTTFPVVIDPKSQTIAIKTPSGVTIINTLPSQALDNITKTDKPTTIQTAVLGAQNGETFYNISGLQERKFMGFIPVTANVETKINAQNGEKISVSKPWYLNIFGFLYSI